MTLGGEDSEGGGTVAQNWVSHNSSSHTHQLLLRFGLVVLDCGQWRRWVGVQLPFAGAHGNCESEVGLESRYYARQVAFSLNAWCAHLCTTELAVAAWSK